MTLDPSLTPTLQLSEVVIGISCVITLSLSIALAADYALDLAFVDPANRYVHLAGAVGLRNSISLAIVSVLFMVFAAIAAFVPPNPNTVSGEITRVIFEAIIVVMGTTAALNLRDRYRIRTARGDFDDVNGHDHHEHDHGEGTTC